MEQNEELRLAWQFIEHTGTHLFLTGKAGTGKTTFLRQLKERSPKRMVVLAPTGIAAINAGGVTIHSFFQLSFAPYVPDSYQNSSQMHYRFSKEKRNIIRSMDLLVIDEISMVRADLLDEIDAVLRRYRYSDQPFGGVQLLMIGDLQQLAPVIRESDWQLLSAYYDTPYFFASRALRETVYKTIELKTVYRQKDSDFLTILNKIRENVADDQTFNLLNKRYLPHFRPDEKEGYIRLTTHNYLAQQINDQELAKLPGASCKFNAHIDGTFPEHAYPTDKQLVIKEKAQIMFVRNDSSSDKRYYNGMLGEIIALTADKKILVRSKETGLEFLLEREVWPNYKYVLDEETKEISEELEGSFEQYPIRLAWAITIHKSQGLTFERAIIDARNSFAHGQTYVALSRCRSLEGLVLEAPLHRDSIISDATVDAFSERMKRTQPQQQDVDLLKKAYFFELLRDLFDFYPLDNAFKRLLRLLDEHLYRVYPQLLNEYKSHLEVLNAQIVEISTRFQGQYTQLISQSDNYEVDQKLQERVHSGASYFYDQLSPLRELWERTFISSDNKAIAKQITERKQALNDALWIKELLLEHFRSESFGISEYVKVHAKVLLDVEMDKSTPAAKRKSTNGEGKVKERLKVEVPSDILHPELYGQLCEWRGRKASELHAPAYTVVQQKALMGLTNLLPDTLDKMKKVPYVGEATLSKYGLELLVMIREYMKAHRLSCPELIETIVEVVPKEKKKESRLVTYEMFIAGKSIEDIAEERTLTRATIIAHLGTYVRENKLDVDRIVDRHKVHRIGSFIESNKELKSLTAIKEALKGDISYEDIKLVLDALYAKEQRE